MNRIQMINRTMMLATAPFIGVMIFLLSSVFTVGLREVAVPELPGFDIRAHKDAVVAKLGTTEQDAAETRTTVEKFIELYDQSAAATASMVKTSTAAAIQPITIFENRFASRLGAKASRSTSTANIDMKLYSFKESKYNGYALKVDLKSSDALKMVLGNDTVGGSETTLSAVKRYGAVAGINAGGYADDTRSGKRYPLSTTIYNGKYVTDFEPSYLDLTFIGFNKNRELIGGKFRSKADLDKKNPEFGATFVPVLLQNGVKQTIPSKWQTSPARAPRTVVGNLSNGQLVFIVTDGYEYGSSTAGATLAELQDKLKALGVKDAYNLDGGGSSSLIYDGKVVNKPSDNGRLRRLPTHFLFFK